MDGRVVSPLVELESVNGKKENIANSLPVCRWTSGGRLLV